MKILFVCVVNVGRSQMAEAFYNFLTNSHYASSAGTNAPKIYKNPSVEIIEVMKEVGIDISKNKVKQLTESMAARAEKIIVFCRKDLFPPFILNSEKSEFIETPDPYQSSLDNHRKVRDAIKLEVEKIVKAESFKIT